MRYRVAKSGGLIPIAPQTKKKSLSVDEADYQRLAQFAHQQGTTLKDAFRFAVGLLPIEKHRKEITVEATETEREEK